MQRIFLGLDKPPLHSAVDFIVDSYRDGDWLDLSSYVLVLPGSRACRRLNELLLERTLDANLRYLPPEVTTVGHVPELLYRPQRPFATNWVQQLTWSWAIRSISPSIRDHVFPAIPADADSTWKIESWLQLGRLLRNCYRELAADGYSFAHVAKAGAQLDEFPEERRWVAMAAIQEAYLRMLDGRQMWDRQTARMVAVDRKECRTEKKLVFVGTSDLNGMLRNMLQQVDSSVVALVAAPESWNASFDTFGCVNPAAWASAEIPIQSQQLIVADGFSEQSQAVIGALMNVSDSLTREQITIGCPDQQLVPYLQRALANHDINGRWAAGRSIRESGPYKLLEVFCEWLRTNRFDAFAALVRHPDIDQWLLDHEIKLGWLNELDRYRNQHLPVHTNGKWLGPAKRRERLEVVWQQIENLRTPFEKPADGLSEWARSIMELLRVIYGSKVWDFDNPHDRFTLGACKAINELLLEQSQLPSDIATSLNAQQAVELVIEQVAALTIGEAADSDAIEMVGWLDTLLEDTAILVMTGMNEGVVPATADSEMFLPDSLREALGISDNRRRYARDAYALKCLTTLRPEMPIIVGRRDMEGNPRVPSRLLFAADDATISQRWQEFFEASEKPAPRVDARYDDSSTTRTFRFDVPKPRKLTTPIEKMRPTDFKLYLECPYRFYLKRVLRYGSLLDDEIEMTGGAFGDVAHEVLNKFGRGKLKNSTSSTEIYSDLARKLTAHCRKQYGPSPSPAVRIQIEQLKMRFYEFSFHQARWAKDYEIAFVEEPTDKLATIETTTGRMKISGRIDRIDRHRETGGYVILDYKTSDSGIGAREAHRSKEKGTWKDLQLPVYRHLAAVMGVEPVTDVGYIILSKKLEDIRFDLAKWSEAELADADQVAEDVVDGVLSERFWPPGKVEWADYDDYRNLLMEGILERKPLNL